MDALTWETPAGWPPAGSGAISFIVIAFPPVKPPRKRPLQSLRDFRGVLPVMAPPTQAEAEHFLSLYALETSAPALASICELLRSPPPEKFNPDVLGDMVRQRLAAKGAKVRACWPFYVDLPLVAVLTFFARCEYSRSTDWGELYVAPLAAPDAEPVWLSVKYGFNDERDIPEMARAFSYWLYLYRNGQAH